MIVVTITATRGSTPREAGTAMAIDMDGQVGTIGGGALELTCVEDAREMIADGAATAERRFSLGPSLGQCCGGAVMVTFERKAGPISEFVVSRPDVQPVSGRLDIGPIWLWGAGHVGRATVAALTPQGGADITWIDSTAERFPGAVHPDITILPAMDMPRLASRAPRNAHHLIFTYSHDIDLALCHALLTRGFASCGLIGSATKWVRFRTRLRRLGHDDASITRITCPIGDPTLGKHPVAIASGVVRALLRQRTSHAALGDCG